jgi:hypothetical protein
MLEKHDLLNDLRQHRIYFMSVCDFFQTKKHKMLMSGIYKLDYPDPHPMMCNIM